MFWSPSSLIQSFSFSPSTRISRAGKCFQIPCCCVLVSGSRFAFGLYFCFYLATLSFDFCNVAPLLENSKSNYFRKQFDYSVYLRFRESGHDRSHLVFLPNEFCTMLRLYVLSLGLFRGVVA